MADGDKKGAGLADAAIGAGAGTVVAASASAIYGMTALKNVKPQEVLATLLADGKTRAEKIVPALEEVFKNSPLGKITETQVDTDKLKTAIETIFKNKGIEVGALQRGADLAKTIASKLTSTEAGEVYQELKYAVADSIQITGIPQEKLRGIVDGIEHLVRTRDTAPLQEAMRPLMAIVTNGDANVALNEEKLSTALKDAIQRLGVKENIEETAGILETVAGPEARAKLNENKVQIFREIREAAAEHTKIPGMTAQQVKNIIAGNPEAMSAELHNVIKQTMEAGQKAITAEAKPMLASAERAGRKIIGSAVYNNVSWYEKPFVAFEAMPVKGKVGLGAAVIGVTSLGTWAASKRHGSHAEAVNNQESTVSQRS